LRANTLPSMAIVVSSPPWAMAAPFSARLSRNTDRLIVALTRSRNSAPPTASGAPSSEKTALAMLNRAPTEASPATERPRVPPRTVTPSRPKLFTLADAVRTGRAASPASRMVAQASVRAPKSAANPP
jgi:hypothetical protein